VVHLKPLLKWAGGKRWLLPVLQEVWAPYNQCKLVEPFAGGLAVALGLAPKAATLNDANEHLINFYRQVAKGLEIDLQLKNKSEYYYQMREHFNALIHAKEHKSKEAAAIFYYLIRTGFNGLCRFNSSGEFNVPFGQHSKINYKTDFFDYKPVLKQWQLSNVDFEELKIKGDEFIYADPPYDVEFTRYIAKDFVWDDQVRLAQWLAKHKGPVVASNQATPRILELYKDLKFKVMTLPAPRMISCNGDRRPALEMLALKDIRK
jgi:DNA adenine methylase